jgi:spore coat protein U-like protein
MRRLKMKKTLILLTIIAVGVFLGAPSFAGDTGQVNINATVVGTCKFTATGGSTTINVTLDPSSGSDVTGTGSLEFWCTKGASYSVTDNGGLYKSGTQQRVKHSSANEYIPYSFSYTPTNGTGGGPSSPITLNVSATFTYSDYSGASAGTYTDTVTITVSP